MALELNGTTGVQGNSGAFIAGTAVASTSGTSIDFTSIPSWVKRVTIMFSGVSTSGSSNIQVQIGAGSVTTTGYISYVSISGSGGTFSYGSITTGFVIGAAAAVNIFYGTLTINLLGSNTYVSAVSGGLDSSGGSFGMAGGGNKTLGGALDRVRITTVNGTDTFDAGSINILYE